MSTLDAKIKRLRSAQMEIVDAAQELAQEVEMLMGTFEPRHPCVHEIIQIVAAHYEVPYFAFVGRSRTTRIAHARQVAMALARESTQLSLEQLGRNFGGRDHGTVIHAVKSVADWIATDQQGARDMACLREAVTRKLNTRRTELRALGETAA